MKPLFISGIGTDVGKTVVSAVLVEKLQADYWKPIQSGDLNFSDTLKVKSLISNPYSKFHPEAYQLTQPFSPHKSAELDGVEIKLNQIALPQTSNGLVIEGAGGLMVPLNRKELIVDLIVQLQAEVIIVSKNYLGSINHTLMTLTLLHQKNISIKGIIFNGEPDTYSESMILDYSGVEFIGRIPTSHQLNRNVIKSWGDHLNLDT